MVLVGLIALVTVVISDDRPVVQSRWACSVIRGRGHPIGACANPSFCWPVGRGSIDFGRTVRARAIGWLHGVAVFAVFSWGRRGSDRIQLLRGELPGIIIRSMGPSGCHRHLVLAVDQQVFLC